MITRPSDSDAIEGGYRIIQSKPKRLDIEFERYPSDLQAAEQRRHDTIKHGLWTAGLVAVVVSVLYFWGLGILFSLFGLIVLPLIVLVYTVQQDLLWMHLHRTPQPVRVRLTPRRLTLKIGGGWLFSSRHNRLKDIRTIQPDTWDQDPTYSQIHIVEWDFTSTMLAPAMPHAVAAELANLLVETINDHLKRKHVEPAGWVTQGTPAEEEANYAAELLRPPLKSKAVLREDGDELQIDIPVRLFGRNLSGLTTAAVLLGFVTAAGWLLSYLAGNWNLNAYLILAGLTAVTLLVITWAWRNFATGYVIRFAPEYLEIIARRPGRDRVDRLSYDRLSSVDLKNEDGVCSLRFYRSRGRRRIILNGQPEAELIWLQALIQHVIGLDR